MLVGRIEKVWPETTRAVGVCLAVPELDERAIRPGQYVLAGDRRTPLVLASGPGEPPMLLVGSEAQSGLALELGGSIALEGPLGGGFPLDAARGHDVLVFAVGTAQGAARSLLQAIAADRASFGRVRAYLGAHTIEDHAYRALDEPWSAAGIEVRRAISKPWVQALFLADDPPSAGTKAFAAGHTAMMIGVRAALTERGMEPNRLGTNA